MTRGPLTWYLPAANRNKLSARRCAVIFVVALSACKRNDASPDEAAKSATAVSVKTTIVVAQPFFETLGAIGSVEPRAGHVALLSAPAPTRVAQVFVSEGQNVSRGATLVALDQTPFATTERSVSAALTAAERNYERARTLSSAGILPRKDLDQATADLAKARADLVTARRALQLATLRSPISGVVTKMAAVLGAAVDANQPLVEIADPTAVDIVLNVTPTQAPRVSPGSKVTLTSGQSAAGEKLGVGAVIDVAGTVDSASRSVEIRARAPATVRPLRIGETIYGQITLATRPNAITVPVAALVPEGDGFKVFVVDTANVVHARTVTVGSRTETIAEITMGLSRGERVVAYGAYGLEDGARIVAAKQ
jgi:membrane fusion protein (multidrug efflux system)